jgi:DNA-binding transcriptional LysR family regulator
MDTSRLRAFREVARHGSFTAAATALQISQPAVSQHIARLEQELGCALLERSSRRVRPTPAGDVFLRYVETLLTGLAETRRELAALACSDSGPLRVAVFPSAVATFVPAAVGALREQFPKVSVLMTEADPPQALPRLLSGDVDFAVCYDYPSIAAPPDPRLRITTLALDRMAVAVSAADAVTRQAPVPLAELAAEQWIAPGPSVCRTALDEACRRAGFSPKVVSETNDYQAMIGLVAAGVGVAVVPRLAAGFAEGRPVRLLPLSATRLARRVDVVGRAGGARTPAMECLQGILAAELTKVLAAATPAAGALPRPAAAGLGRSTVGYSF